MHKQWIKQWMHMTGWQKLTDRLSSYKTPTSRIWKSTSFLLWPFPGAGVTAPVSAGPARLRASDSSPESGYKPVSIRKLRGLIIRRYAAGEWLLDVWWQLPALLLISDTCRYFGVYRIRPQSTDDIYWCNLDSINSLLNCSITHRVADIWSEK